ncbi:hypothetical protein FA95DRAFT_1613454 [Auriscalpium vulgare]|uniref:Uncharacterized protein n=1 Tax=Auriscalpium vulgare TaxID=40419 RepID=A0ACB8R2P8_9AGAM|nr:hypothetical protein FA95DRAFT_1613454 [Auriscalpium vulgare]
MPGTRSQSAPRRSARLSLGGATPPLAGSSLRGRHAAQQLLYVDVPARRPSKRQQTSPHAPSSSNEREQPATVSPSPSPSASARPAVVSKVPTPEFSHDAIQKMVAAGVHEEVAALNAREAEVAAREAALEKQVELVAELACARAGDAAQPILDQLEDQLNCPLCLDVIACPYSLVAYNCGHAFCALCIIKWFFSRLHECGDWHEPVECPLCRAPAVKPPARPFVHGRAFDRVVADAVDALRDIAAATADALQAAADALHPPAPAPPASKKRKRGRRSAPAPPPAPPAAPLPAPLAEWAHGGARRVDWATRTRLGREAMDDALARWPTLDAPGFLLIKAALAV